MDSPAYKRAFGPWQAEPDREYLRLVGDRFGFLIRDPESGAWCGYIGLETGHPLVGVSADLALGVLFAHGGIAYAGPPIGTHDEDPGVYWLGFRCDWLLDLTPAKAAAADAAGTERPPVEYRSLGYARRQLRELGNQVEEFARIDRELGGEGVGPDAAASADENI